MGATKIKLTAESLDSKGNVVSVDANIQPIDRDTILTFDVEMDDGGKVKIGPPIPRPKKPRI
jgi:hypothetical protein